MFVCSVGRFILRMGCTQDAIIAVGATQFLCVLACESFCGSFFDSKGYLKHRKVQKFLIYDYLWSQLQCRLQRIMSFFLRFSLLYCILSLLATAWSVEKPPIINFDSSVKLLDGVQMVHH